MWNMHDGIGWWGVMGIVWIIIVGLVIWGIVALLRGRGQGSTTDDKDSPLEIAKRRYARGEISKEQYEEIKKNL